MILLRPTYFTSYEDAVKVLILVVVDDTLAVVSSLPTHPEFPVLILVVVDDTLAVY